MERRIQIASECGLGALVATVLRDLWFALPLAYREPHRLMFITSPEPRVPEVLAIQPGVPGL